MKRLSFLSLTSTLIVGPSFANNSHLAARTGVTLGVFTIEELIQPLVDRQDGPGVAVTYQTRGEIERAHVAVARSNNWEPNPIKGELLC